MENVFSAWAIYTADTVVSAQVEQSINEQLKLQEESLGIMAASEVRIVHERYKSNGMRRLSARLRRQLLKAAFGAWVTTREVMLKRREVISRLSCRISWRGTNQTFRAWAKHTAAVAATVMREHTAVQAASLHAAQLATLAAAERTASEINAAMEQVKAVGVGKLRARQGRRKIAAAFNNWSIRKVELRRRRMVFARLWTRIEWRQMRSAFRTWTRWTTSR
eukprot:SAG31_NODE_3345_length_4377_cov_3.568256_2_plen_221_part_00